jgi:hypothetical protein
MTKLWNPTTQLTPLNNYVITSSYTSSYKGIIHPPFFLLQKKHRGGITHPLFPVTTIAVKKKHKGGHGKPPLFLIIAIVAKKKCKGGIAPFFLLL